MKLSIGGPAEKIVSAFHVVLSGCTNEDAEMAKCKSAVHRVKKMERDVDVALTKGSCQQHPPIHRKGVETNRVALVSQLRDVLHEQFQESELENLRIQMPVAQAQVEEATNMWTRLDDENRVFDPKPLTDANDKSEQTSQKSTAAIAAEVADKLTASTSSQYIMSSVFSTFAAQEAQSAGLTTLKSENPNNKVHYSVFVCCCHCCLKVFQYCGFVIVRCCIASRNNCKYK
ncbi:hypothetical protein CASFOL_018578 [Castilleja foliolosa]|uniref:Uncharacterized protein n=1 Tax=Castilleja foliolosa TaxID=1961234 RepID=A0ABD3D540_9LAMI